MWDFVSEMANDPFQFVFDHVHYGNVNALTMEQAREMSDDQLILHPVARVALRRGWYLANSSRTADGRPIRRGNQDNKMILDRAVTRLTRMLSEAPEPKAKWIEMIETSMQRIVSNVMMRPPWTERSPMLERLPRTDRSLRIKNPSRTQRPPRVQRPAKPRSPIPEPPPTEMTSPPRPDNKL